MKYYELLPSPNAETRRKVIEELNLDESSRDQDLADIKDWLSKQPHLPNEWEDTCLLSFLRGCNYSLEKTKRKLDLYFTMRTNCPDFFQNRDITRPELVHLAHKAIGVIMPGLTTNGRRVSICRAAKNPGPSDWINGFKITLMLGDLRLREETEPIGGEIYVIDASVASSGHIRIISPALLEAYPVKIREIHIVTTTPAVELLLTAAKNFLSDKIKKRIFLHKDHTTLHEYIPKELLPAEYGGTGLSLEEVQNLWIEKLKTYTEWFKKQETIKSNEALRPGNPINLDELFGMEGSFRQLTID